MSHRHLEHLVVRRAKRQEDGTERERKRVELYCWKCNGECLWGDVSGREERRLVDVG